MDIQKKQVSANMPVTHFDTSVIVDSDAIVSDSKPDLLKVIQIDPSVRITKTDLLNGKMMIGGHMSYKILYQPENAEGICSMFTSADFSHMEENANFSDGMYADVTADTEHVEWEIINSRKIKIKSVIGLNVNVSCSAPVSLPLEVSGDNIQVKYCDYAGHQKMINKRDIITVSDSLSLPSGKPNIGTLLKSDASICSKDVKVISGKVIVKGDVAVNNLYIPEGTNSVDFCSHSLPFTEILDAEGISENDICKVKTEIDDCDFSLATDSDGDVRVINSTIRIGVKICADTPISERVITDAYSLTDNLEITASPVAFKKDVASSYFSHTVKASVSPGNISSVYNITAKPAVTSWVSGDNSVMLEGYIDACVLCITQGEVCPIKVHTEEIPFKIEADLPGCHPGADVSAHIETADANCLLTTSGDLGIRITLSCNVTASEKGTIDIVDKIESTGPADEKSPSIVLYFVQKNDTLWDIAKRYHTKSEYIEELNGEAVNPLKCGSQILIPRG